MATISGSFVATAYGPPWGGINGGGTTATGITLPANPTGSVGPPYIVAVDPSVIPLHTRLKISPNPTGNPNIVWSAEDTGGAIKGNRIDFLDLAGRSSQDNWGVRTVSVTSTTAAASTTASGTGTDTTGAATPNTNTAGQFFYIGDTNDPDEDYWTGINRNAQAAQWYLFSDGEILYVADGYKIMAQVPAKLIDRWVDPVKQTPNPDILHCSVNYDNSAWMFAATHKKRGKIQRKSTLAKVTSPTEITMDLICRIDEIRAGDTVYLNNFGMANGPWLVGNCTRSIFTIYSELTLVPAVIPVNVGSAGSGSTPAPGSGASGSPGGNQPVNTAGIANPLAHGWTIGRTDAGIDANAAPGTPIYALASGTVVEVLQGWYAGQPLYLFKTDKPYQTAGGPQSYWYIAEQIHMTVSQGQHVNAGQQIGTYASSGTGIEIGIGSPTSNSRTLAGQMGQGDGGGAGTDAGRWFRSLMGQLGAKV